MPIRVQCPGCGKFSKAPDAYVGRIEKCPACGASVVIRSAAATETNAKVSPLATATEPERNALFAEIDTRPQSSGSKPTGPTRTTLFPMVVTGGICLLAGFLIAIFIRGSGPTSEERRPVPLTAQSKSDNPINLDVEGLQATIDELRHQNESLTLDNEKFRVQLSRDVTAALSSRPQPPPKGLSGKVDGASFSYENLNWRLEDSGLLISGNIRNETGSYLNTAYFLISLDDRSNQLVGRTFFSVQKFDADATALFTAYLPNFSSDPGDSHVRIQFTQGVNAQYTPSGHKKTSFRDSDDRHDIPAFHRFTTDSGSLDIEARIFDVQDGMVTLERSNRKRIQVKLELLTEGNRGYVQQWITENQKPPLPFHRFTSDSGLLNIEAKIVDFQDGVVTLERQNGEQVKAKLDFLSDGDKTFVQQWIAKNQKP